MPLRYFLIAFFLCFSGQIALGKIYKTREYYPNGKIKFIGKYTICVKREVETFTDIYEHRKYGKWIYYHSSGHIKRIEYHSKLKSCDEKSYKTGTWQYFNEQGILYKQEKYRHDTLTFLVKEIYEDQKYLGSIKQQDNIVDTIDYSVKTSFNLIPNASFDQFYYKPIQINNNGQDQIEALIPGWYSPNGGTPDYFNKYRNLSGVPMHINPKRESFVGLMLYFHPKYRYEDWEHQNKTEYTNEYIYSESIQAKLHHCLEPGKKYCFKARIALSELAGLKLNKIGVYLLQKPIFYENDRLMTKPDLILDLPTEKQTEWDWLCTSFISSGNEKYITLGRIKSPEIVSISHRTPAQKSPLDINNAAYYLLDEVQVYKETPEHKCECETLTIQNISKPIVFEEILSFSDKIDERKYVLKNLLFEFNKFDLPEDNLDNLIQLKTFLENNPSIEIYINGFTDKKGSESYNLDLSLKRAQAVMKWLEQNGIDSDRISCKGYGYKESIDADYLNRRVEIEIIKN